MDSLFRGFDPHKNIVADEVNKNIKQFDRGAYRTDIKPYNRILEKKSISIENKKDELLKSLHNLVIRTFAINFDKAKKGWLLKEIKNNLKILRALTIKLRDINYHLETTFLDEIGLLQKPAFAGINRIKRLVKEDSAAISKKDINKLEDTAYRLIGRIINLDKRLMREYKAKEKAIIKKQRFDIKDLESVLKKQSELLCHLEAKLPPPNKIHPAILKQKNFTRWVSRVLALLCMIEYSCAIEKGIFSKLKSKKSIERKIRTYIRHLIEEKWELLEIKQKKVMSWDKAEEIDKEWKRINSHWATLANL